MRSVKSRSKSLKRRSRLQRGGGKGEIEITIEDFYSELIRGNSHSEHIFGKNLIFILKSINNKYPMLEDTYIEKITINKKEIDVSSTQNLNKILTTKNKETTILIYYNDEYKTNSYYIDIKRNALEDIEKSQESLHRFAATKFQGWSGMEMVTSPHTPSADEGEVEYPSQGGKRSRKRRRTTGRRKSRKYK